MSTADTSIGKMVRCGSATSRNSPDYLTQGESLEDLEDNLRDLYRDLTSGEIPGIRRSPNYPSDEAGRLIRSLEEAGCVLIRHGGKHDWYRNPTTGVSQPVPRHGSLD